MAQSDQDQEPPGKRGNLTFANIYNQIRTHRALHGTTPAQAYTATIKAAPAGQPGEPHYRVRNETVDRLGKISLRRAGRMHHLGIGAAHKGQAVTILTGADTVTVIHRDTGDRLSEHSHQNHYRNTQHSCGRRTLQLRQLPEPPHPRNLAGWNVAENR